MSDKPMPRIVLGDFAEAAVTLLRQARSGSFLSSDDPASEAYRRACMWWHLPTQTAVSLIIDDSNLIKGGPRGWAFHVGFFQLDAAEGMILPIPQDRVIARRWVEAVYHPFERMVLVRPPTERDSIQVRLSDQHTYIMLCAHSNVPKVVDDVVVKESGVIRFDDFFGRVA